MFAVLALAATIGLAGCEGDTGPSGPGEPSGGGGTTGPTGPTGPADTPISLGGDVKAIGNGSTLTAQQIADIGTLIATIDSATITDNKPVLEITVKTAHGGNVLGLAPATLRLGIAKLVPATAGVPSRWQSYINRSVAASSAGGVTPVLPNAIQANVETGVATGWTELGAGRYRYVSTVDLANVTTPIAVPYEPTLTHRLSIAVDLSGSAGPLEPDNAYLDFVPAGGTATSKLIATTANCAGCHVRFGEHGGSRRTVEYCVVCHNAGTTDPESGESVDLAYLAHSIHRGENRTSPYVVYGFNNSVFDTGEVTYPQPASFCETCHTQSDATPQGDDWNTTVTASACGGCHDAGLGKTGPDPATGRYAYTYTHSNAIVPPQPFNDGDCLGCHGAGRVAGTTLALHQRDDDRKRIEQGDLFTYRIVNIENAAVGQQPKVTFQILDENDAPVDVKAITTGRLRLDFAWSTADIHNVADVAGDAYAANRGEAIVVDLIAEMANVVDNQDGTFSYTLATPLPSGFADAALGSGLMVVMEGRRDMPDGSQAWPESAFRFSGGTAREALVSQEKCETCHKRVAAHGGSRAGDPMICTVCHNSSVGGTFGTNVIGPLALGAFIHNVHASKVAGVGEITYPQSLARCEGCHLTGKFNVARTSALPITVDAGTTATSGPETLPWQDDLADSATAGTCRSCHDGAEALTHMESQGGSFAQPKTLTPSSAQEGCSTCHAAGRTYDSAALHCGTLPFGQCTQ
jgi:OmcA/MtrC family decaheme c-type cytochrome